jgi:hypothetical protein
VAGRRVRVERRARRSAAWQRLAAGQAGAVSRAQLIDAGLTPGQIGGLLDSGRWTSLQPGVYAVFTGPVPPITRVWAALLASGPGAALAGETALWLWGVVDKPARLQIAVPWERRVVAGDGVEVRRRRRLDDQVHPAAEPRRLRLEDALLDEVAAARSPAEVIELVLRATARRRTTAHRLRRAALGRKRLRFRGLLLQMLGETAEGVQSALEHLCRRDVERRHGLPKAERNRPEPQHDPRGRRVRHRYRDIRYRRWRVLVELDGLAAHPEWLRHLDRRRDNSGTVRWDRVLRYGWHEVVVDPCGTAYEIAVVLWQQGWRAVPRPCGPSCPLARFDPASVG